MKRTYSDAMSLSDSKNGLSFELHSGKNKLKARARLKLINGKLDCGTIIHKKHSEGQLLNLVEKEFHFVSLKFNFNKFQISRLGPTLTNVLLTFDFALELKSVYC